MAKISYLTDSFTGILSGNGNVEELKEERLREKYEVTDDANILLDEGKDQSDAALFDPSR